MRRITLAAGALAALMLFGMEAETAEANPAFSSFGLHIGGRNAALSIGTASLPAYAVSNYPAYRRPYSNPYWYGYDHRARVNHYRHAPDPYFYGPGRDAPRRDRCDARPGNYVRNSYGNWIRREAYHHGGRW